MPEYNTFVISNSGQAKLLDTSLMHFVDHDPSIRLPILSEKAKDICRNHIHKRRDTPKLFAYYISDEPEVRGINAKALEQVYQIFSEEDPYHPVIISNYAMHSIHTFARTADINGLHPYPLFLKDKRVNDLSSVIIAVEGAVKAFKNSKHKQTIAYLHQGFNYGDYGSVSNRIPTYTEYRNQNLLALICGANGFIQYNRMYAHYPELYIGMPHLVREKNALGPVVLAPVSKIQPTTTNSKVKMLLKEYDGHLYLFVCNAQMMPQTISIDVPGLGLRAKELSVLSQGRVVSLDGDRLTDQFDTFEANVYTTATELPDLLTVSEIVELIDKANRKRHKLGNLVFQMDEGGDVVVTASSHVGIRHRRPDTGLWHVVDGVISQSDRYQSLTWQDQTDRKFPDWLEIKMPHEKRIGRVVVYPYQKSLRDYIVQAFIEGQWKDLAQVTGQNSDRIEHPFEAVVSDRIRIYVTAANSKKSMITEIEVYEK